jgi:hypothetical protein
MSAEVQESSKKGKGSKQKKMTVRVDFTPLQVDMTAYASVAELASWIGEFK